ncbi:MAG: TetR/AcrR family transcriptional regulator [Candidatus Acidiferrales bacterium]
MKTTRRKRKTRARARPRAIRTRLDVERLGELLDVAAEEFIREGFSAASTNEIARRANSSKTTFYSRFPTKEKLFLAVIERRMSRKLREAAAGLPEEPPVAETLRNYAAALIRGVLSKDQLALVRVISMESVNFPELGKRFYERGPKRGEAIMAAYFEKQVEKGRLSDDDTQRMAEHFLSLITGGPIRWFMLAFDPNAPSQSALEKHINAAIEVFMRAYGRDSTAAN